MLTASCEVFRETGDFQSLAISLNHVGSNSLALGDVPDAQNSFTGALRLAHESGHLPLELEALAGLAVLWAGHSAAERALELITLILQHPSAAPETKSRAVRLRAELESRMTPQQIQTSQVQAQERTIDQLISKVLAQSQWFEDHFDRHS